MLSRRARTLSALAIGASTVLTYTTASAGELPPLPFSPETQSSPEEHWSGVAWSYSGNTGPEYWATLDPSYAACAHASQTPINVVSPTATSKAAPLIKYTSGTVTGFNNGHTIQVTAADGNTVKVNGTTSTLLQMHFHAPSEHTINGKAFPAEAHFVNEAADGSLTVIGVMLTTGAARNSAWAPFVRTAQLPADTTRKALLNWPATLPANKASIRYSGSLTTPPCTEGVNWVLLTTPVSINAVQMKALKAAYDHNARPVQPLNDRTVIITKKK